MVVSSGSGLVTTRRHALRLSGASLAAVAAPAPAASSEADRTRLKRALAEQLRLRGAPDATLDARASAPVNV